MANRLQFSSEEAEEQVTPPKAKQKAKKRRYYKQAAEDKQVETVEAESPKQSLETVSKIQFEEDAKVETNPFLPEKESEAAKTAGADPSLEEVVQEPAFRGEPVKAETPGTVRKKQHKRIFEEHQNKKSSRLKFEKEPGEKAADRSNPGAKKKGKAALTASPVDTIKGTATGKVRDKVDEDSDDNSAVEAANRAEETAEGAVSRLTDTVKSHTVSNKSKSSEKLSLDPEESGVKTAPLKFEEEAAGDIQIVPKGAADSQSKLQQKIRYRREYAAAQKTGKSTGAAGSSVFGGSGSTAASKGAESFTEKLKNGVADFVRNNKGWIAVLLLVGMALIMMINGVGAMGSLITGGGNAILESSYLASDDDLHAAEDFYAGKEAALQRQINNIESTYPGYDEYNVQVDEISHNPYTLMSYLTVKYGNFTMDMVRDELNSLFQAQYHLSVESTTREEVETDVDPETGEETETVTTIHILNVTLTNSGLETVAFSRLGDEQATGWYTLLNSSYGNRSYLWDTNVFQGYAPGGMSFEIPPEALEDDQFRRMITEAEKYLGYPYVWGGSSPSTSFDCSGFVSWVVNHSGNGWDVGRSTAEGLRRTCTYVAPSQAKPGDLIFFQGTYNTSGASHVGIYVGNGKMLHCGNPIQYASIETNYWQQHFYCFGRLP